MRNHNADNQSLLHGQAAGDSVGGIAKLNCRLQNLSAGFRGDRRVVAKGPGNGGLGDTDVPRYINRGYPAWIHWCTHPSNFG